MHKFLIGQWWLGHKKVLASFDTLFYEGQTNFESS
jgi:hypothetical protein